MRAIFATIPSSTLRLAAAAMLALAFAPPTTAAAQQAEAQAPAEAEAEAAADFGTIESIVVTARKREESLQEIPISISAFGAEDLEAAQIEDVADLQFNIPSVFFHKGNFSGAGNFAIRGIGSLLVAASGDPATGIHVNSSSMHGARIFEFEMFDIERLEVLRGPQGTLFGRSSPAGVVNMITKKPGDEFGGFVKAEYGNFDNQHVQGAVTIPYLESHSMRLTGHLRNRDGFTENLTTGNKIDDRDLWSIRASFNGQFGEDTDYQLMLQYGEEQDNRMRITRSGCTRDLRPFPLNIGCAGTGALGNDVIDDRASLGYQFALNLLNGLNFPQNHPAIAANPAFAPGLAGLNMALAGLNAANPALFPNAAVPATALVNVVPSVGLLNGNPNTLPLFSDAQIAAIQAAGGPQGAALAGLARGFRVSNPNFAPPPGAYENSVHPEDPRKVNARFDPVYDVYDFVGTFELNHNIGDILLSSVSGYRSGRVISQNDYFLATPSNLFSEPERSFVYQFPDSPIIRGGTFDREFAFDNSEAQTKLFTQEVRAASDFDGMVNFTVGANYFTFDSYSTYAVYTTSLERFWNSAFAATAFGCTTALGDNARDDNPANDCMELNPQRSYFAVPTFYTLRSHAVFGEMYVDITDRLRATVGARWTQDSKRITERGGDLGPGSAANGHAPSPTGSRKAEWNKWTGKVGLDYQLFDDSLLYASIATGFKGGGFNSPCSAEVGCNYPDSFEPEEITAFEIGSKNQFMDNTLQLNANFFYYDYADLQISQIVNRQSINENIDATNKGAELELLWFLTDQLQIDVQLAWLDTEIDEVLSVDQADPTGGLAGIAAVKVLGAASNQIIFPTGSPFIGMAPDPRLFPGLVPGTTSCNGLDSNGNIMGTPLAAAAAPNTTCGGVAQDLSGNDLPNAPEITIRLGAAYTFDVTDGWLSTARVDYYWQDEIYSRIYNGRRDLVDTWERVNAQLHLASPDSRWNAILWANNITDNSDVTGHYLTDASSANFTNQFILEPRTYGVSLQYNFGGEAN